MNLQTSRQIKGQTINSIESVNQALANMILSKLLSFCCFEREQFDCCVWVVSSPPNCSEAQLKPNKLTDTLSLNVQRDSDGSVLAGVWDRYPLRHGPYLEPNHQLLKESEALAQKCQSLGGKLFVELREELFMYLF